MLKALPALSLALFISSNSFGQLSVPLQQLKSHLSKPDTKALNSSDAFFKNYDFANKRINYLYPVYMLLMNEEKSKFLKNASELFKAFSDLR